MDIITSITVEGSAFVLRNSEGGIVATVPSQSAGFHRHETRDDTLYISADSNGRDVIARKYPVQPSVLTVPAGPWTVPALLEELVQMQGSAKPAGVTDVSIQDDYTDVIDLFVARTISSIALPADVAKDSAVFDILSGVAPLAGNWIGLQDSERFAQSEILAVAPVAGNRYTVTLAEPVATSFFAVSTIGRISSPNLNVDGSVTPVDFVLPPAVGTKWHITAMSVAMTFNATAGDDGKFGNLTALAKGVYFRKEDGQSSQALFNLKENSDLRLEGGSLDYTARSGGLGQYGASAVIPIRSLRGIVIQLDGSKNEYFKVQVRDDLSALVRFRVKLLGHVVRN